MDGSLDADIVFEFDADGSHQPCYIKNMLSEFGLFFEKESPSLKRLQIKSLFLDNTSKKGNYLNR